MVLEALEGFGGTWLTHRYPGIRSDSDLYTFGYRFKPWVGAPIATADEILQLHGRGDRRERPRVATSATATRSPAQAGRATTISGPSRRCAPTPARRRASPPISSGCARATTATPKATRRDWEGMADFKGRIVHPQTWPEDLDYKGKNVVVIGSGATAATLIPAIAERLRARDHAAALADLFHPRPQRERPRRPAARARDRRDLDPRDRPPQASCTTRTPSPARSLRGARGGEAGAAGGRARLSGPGRRRRDAFHAELSALAAAHRLRAGRRLFQGIKAGKASVVTDEIERFTEKGILLKSGKAARSRHHHHRDRLQSQRAGRHRRSSSTASRSISPTPSPIAA